jgi:hypothetical protein
MVHRGALLLLLLLLLTLPVVRRCSEESRVRQARACR